VQLEDFENNVVQSGC